MCGAPVVVIAKGGTGSQCAASLRGRTELAHPTAARTGHGTQGAYTQQQHTKKEKKRRGTRRELLILCGAAAGGEEFLCVLFEWERAEGARLDTGGLLILCF